MCVKPEETRLGNCTMTSMKPSWKKTIHLQEKLPFVPQFYRVSSVGDSPERSDRMWGKCIQSLVKQTWHTVWGRAPSRSMLMGTCLWGRWFGLGTSERIRLSTEILIYYNYCCTWLSWGQSVPSPDKCLQRCMNDWYQRQGGAQYWLFILNFVSMVRRVKIHGQSKAYWLCDVTQHLSHPGGRLNKKDGLTRYGNSHVKDKTS